jgi:hypothetical protein
MKIKIGFVIIITTVMSCKGKMENNAVKPSPIPVAGTWKLITGTIIDKTDTAVTDYTKKISFIKIINDTHFAFLKHDLNKGKDSVPVFVSGGGSYSLSDSLYTEHLEYCSARNWEGNDFTFTISIIGDTLIQSGVEKIESEGVNRINVEKYIRMKK